MGCTDAVGCLVTLACWQCWQSLHQKDTSDFMPGHTNLELTRQLVACVPGCATLWMAENTRCLSPSGTRDLLLFRRQVAPQVSPLYLTLHDLEGGGPKSLHHALA
jgi:hypothetical protein